MGRILGILGDANDISVNLHLRGLDDIVDGPSPSDENVVDARTCSFFRFPCFFNLKGNKRFVRLFDLFSFLALEFCFRIIAKGLKFCFKPVPVYRGCLGF